MVDIFRPKNVSVLVAQKRDPNPFTNQKKKNLLKCFLVITRERESVHGYTLTKYTQKSSDIFFYFPSNNAATKSLLCPGES